VFYDIAQLLESAENSETRVVRVLERLRSLVPYDHCAVLEVLPEEPPRLVTAPGTPPAERAELTATLTALLSRLAEKPNKAAEDRSKSGVHLAVPLIRMDDWVGVLFVRRLEGVYAERHVRALSVIAAKLAAYFSILHAFAREAERAQELADARQAAEAADRAKDEFLALVSHELRSPLGAILAWTDALRSSDTSQADRTRAVEAIERSVRAQAKLVAELLDLSCVSAAALRLDLRAVDPGSVIRTAVRALQDKAATKAIRLEVAIDESVAPLMADPRRLNQIIAHLVANGIKFTPAGGHVEVRLERAGARARIRVIDSGEGIRPELLSKLFEPFIQVDRSTTRPHTGLGLGLALVKDLVELHGGNVRAESSGLHQGATFTVELPLAKPAAPAEEGATQSGEPPKRELSGIRVLLVDDDDDIGEVLSSRSRPRRRRRWRSSSTRCRTSSSATSPCRVRVGMT
jgi:signal transduction histidine kinase